MLGRVLLTAATVLLLSSWARTEEDPLEGLDAYVVKSMADWEVPGLALSIVHRDRVVFAKGFGVRELGKLEPVDENTLFAVASNSKAFTAALLGMLVDEKKITWDDRVIDHLPGLHLHDPWVSADIRIRDLLIHRSGLPTFGGDHLWIGSSLTSEEILRRLRYLEPSAPFRTRYQYQNLMFLLAGEIVPAVTGSSWSSMLKTRIFDPLGMTRSNSSVRDLDGEANVATPHEEVDGRLSPVSYDNVDSIAPAGAINSTVLDMTAWMRLNLSSGVFADQRLLSDRVVADMQTVQMPLGVAKWQKDAMETDFAGYGLGWGLSEYAGYKLVAHGGGLSGMNSRQLLVPEISLGVMVVTNHAPNALSAALTLHVLDVFLGRESRDWSGFYLKRRDDGRKREEAREKKRQESRVKETRPSLALTAYAGRYHSDLSGPATVDVRDGQLYYEYNARHRGPLEHWHYDTFRVHWQNPIYDMPDKAFLTFDLDANGKVEKLTVSFYDPQAFIRQDPNGS